MVTKRSIATCIILSIVTCGIYGLIWVYNIMADCYTITGRPNKAGTDILLGIVTCGIWYFVMSYRMGTYMAEARQKFNMPAKDDSTIYLLLAIFGLSIVTYCLAQSALNEEFANN